MKVNLGTIEVTVAMRRAVNKRMRQPGLASHDEVRDFIVCGAMDEVLIPEAEAIEEDAKSHCIACGEADYEPICPSCLMDDEASR